MKIERKVKAIGDQIQMFEDHIEFDIIAKRFYRVVRFYWSSLDLKRIELLIAYHVGSWI